MVKKLFNEGRKLLTGPQDSVMSAATIIMIAIAAAKVLGLLSKIILIKFFTTEDVSIFFAAFRLPDTIFEILVFGTFSSAFIPVFAKAANKSIDNAWQIAGSVANIGLIIFLVFSLFFGVFAEHIYTIFTPGYSAAQIKQITMITRVLLSAQIFFVISYVLTGVLESLKRFLVPALAPLFYNVGIIVGTITFSDRFGLVGPALGVLLGAMAHFFVQLPLAVKLGFRFHPRIKITSEVKKIGELAAPRMVEVTFLQVTKMVELFLASLLTTASYAYFTLANSLQLMPVTLFGTSIAKAALPTLSSQSDDLNKFKKTMWNGLHQMVFLILPIATVLIVLRIPIVRIVYGRELFEWEDTVQTGMVLSAFAFGIVFQAASALLARSFYALQDTKTPVAVSIISMVLIVFFDFLFIYELNLPVWGLAAAFSIGSFFQALMLLVLINKKIGDFSFKYLLPELKAFIAASISGLVMFVLLKFLDLSVWVKSLSFVTGTEITRNLQFERFVLDTRYTVNLLLLTIFVSLVGLSIYLFIAYLFKLNELWVMIRLVKRVLVKHKLSPIPQDEKEPLSPVTTDSI